MGKKSRSSKRSTPIAARRAQSFEYMRGAKITLENVRKLPLAQNQVWKISHTSVEQPGQATMECLTIQDMTKHICGESGHYTAIRHGPFFPERERIRGVTMNTMLDPQDSNNSSKGPRRPGYILCDVDTITDEQFLNLKEDLQPLNIVVTQDLTKDILQPGIVWPYTSLHTSNTWYVDGGVPAYNLHARTTSLPQEHAKWRMHVSVDDEKRHTLCIEDITHQNFVGKGYCVSPEVTLGDCFHAIHSMMLKPTGGGAIAGPRRPTLILLDVSLEKWKSEMRREFHPMGIRVLSEGKDDECQVCQKVWKGCMLCTSCKRVVYCSGECQKKDWPTHKAFCREQRGV